MAGWLHLQSLKMDCVCVCVCLIEAVITGSLWLKIGEDEQKLIKHILRLCRLSYSNVTVLTKKRKKIQ